MEIEKYKFKENLVEIKFTGLKNESESYDIYINGIKIGNTFKSGNVYRGIVTLYYMLDKKECIESKIYYNRKAKLLIVWLVEHFFFLLKKHKLEDNFLNKSLDNGFKAAI